MPETLYKYRSLSENNYEFTREIFLQNKLYFPHPDQINDPFDCKIPPSRKNRSKKEYLAHLEKIKSKTNDCNVLAIINSAIANVNSNDMETIEQKLYEQYKKSNLQNVGVLSLSKKPLDIRMWSHYADSHRGICIGFDYEKLLFTFNHTPQCAHEVNYPKLNEYPLWDYLDRNDEEIIVKLFLTKALYWKYEQEWRIVLPEKGRTLKKFHPTAMVSVYLGCQISKKHKEDVIDWCLRREQKPKIYQTTKSESSYSLQTEEILYNK